MTDFEMVSTPAEKGAAELSTNNEEKRTISSSPATTPKISKAVTIDKSIIDVEDDSKLV